MLRNATLKQKLITGFAVLLLCMLAGAGYSILVIRGLTSVFSTATGIHELGKIATASSDMVGLERAIVLHSIFDHKAQVEQYKSQFESTSQVFDQSLQRVSARVTSLDARTAIALLRQKHTEWKPMHKDVLNLLASQQVDLAERKVAEAIASTSDEIRRRANDLSENQARLLETEGRAARVKSFVSSIAMVALSLGLGTVALLYISRLSQKLYGLTESLASSSGQVAVLSEEVFSASETTAEGAKQQAGSLAESAASGDRISTLTKRNVANTNSMASVISVTAQQVSQANVNLTDMLSSMKEITGSSENIGRIIKTIDEIAFQTNILALNAAVEAARAGEAGMGFAVVADEVRNLAQRCSEAARDTAELIEKSIHSTVEGSQKLNKMASAIEAITKSTQKVRSLTDEVTGSSNEQAHGIEEMSHGLASIEAVTKATATNAERGATAGRNLRREAESLSEIVSDLSGMLGLRQESIGT